MPDTPIDAELARLIDDLLPEGWDHNAGRFGMSFTLTCPHGYEIEQDGRCPEGCVSARSVLIACPPSRNETSWMAQRHGWH